VIATRDPAVLAIRYDWRNNSVLFVHNLDEKPREVSFSVGVVGDGGKHLINLLSENHSEANDRGKHRMMLEAYGYRWYRRRTGLSAEANRHRRCERKPSRITHVI
jgi:maltose alpha-D-glucosyltransferase / alpha-amylase